MEIKLKLVGLHVFILYNSLITKLRASCLIFNEQFSSSVKYPAMGADHPLPPTVQFFGEISSNGCRPPVTAGVS